MELTVLNSRAIAIARMRRNEFAHACAKKGEALLNEEVRAKENLLATLKDGRVRKYVEEESVFHHLLGVGFYRAMIRFKPYRGQHLSGVHYGFRDEEDLKTAFCAMEKEWRGNVSVAFTTGSFGTEIIISVTEAHI